MARAVQRFIEVFTQYRGRPRRWSTSLVIMTTGW